MSSAIAIAGIHTGIGKTIVSAILTEALEADYWKPVQAGSLDDSDSILVRKLVSNKKTQIHPEAVRLELAASPHAAAAKENRQYDCRQFIFPETENTLIVETAGGLFSPMDDGHTMADFISYHDLPTILVTRHYLGSINHTLLCLETMKQRGIKLLGLIVNGPTDEASESFIKNYAGIEEVFFTSELSELTPNAVQAEAARLKSFLSKTILHEQNA